MDAGHSAAFFGAMLARFGAGAAMLRVMPPTFFRAGVADIGADAANLVNEPRAAAHEGRATPALAGAIEAQPSAIGHVRHAGALDRAMLALLRATHARLDTGLMFQMCHGGDPPVHGVGFWNEPKRQA